MSQIVFQKPKGVELETLKCGDFYRVSHYEVLYLVLGRNNQRQMRVLNMNTNEMIEVDVKLVVLLVPHHTIKITVS